MYPGYGAHITRNTCSWLRDKCSPTQEHIILVICPLLKNYISLRNVFPLPRARNQRSQNASDFDNLQVKEMSTSKHLRVRIIHVSKAKGKNLLVVSLVASGKILPAKICKCTEKLTSSPNPETHIRSDKCSFTQET